MKKKEYNSMTVEELRSICKSMGLLVKGKKAELIERIETKKRHSSDKQDSKLKNLEKNIINVQKEKLNVSDTIDLKDEPDISKTVSIKKDQLKNTFNNFKRKTPEDSDPSAKTAFKTNDISQNWYPHVKLNTSRKLKKIVIKFVEKAHSPTNNTINPVPTQQLTDSVSDFDIYPISIGKPPPLALRRKIITYSYLFARFASCLPSIERYNFLFTLSLVSKLWNFAVKFAWHQLILLEFPGKRTENWILSVDTTIHSLRLWYIHRQKEKQHSLKFFKKSWLERLFRVYGQTFSFNSPTPQNELWFSGIHYSLLSNPDEKGQWEVSLRFWISRFVLRMMSGEPWESWHAFFDQVYDDMIIQAKSIGNTDIWKIECCNNNVWYISGQSGEAIGWDFSSTSRDLINIKNITWKNLRFDWKNYISNIIDNTSSSNLFDCVFYHGDTNLYPHGIHKSIKDPLKLSLAKRFVLSHVIEYGVSGSYQSRPFSYGLNSKLVLDLEQKYAVESVRLSGEIALNNQILCLGLSYIQTMEVGMFVLDEIGLEVGDDVCGVRDIWTFLLGCDTWGKALDNSVAEKILISLFQPGTSLYGSLTYT